MKKIIAAALIAAATSAMAVVPARVGPVSTYGKLKAAKISNKGQLVGSCPAYNNTPVQVKGMSLFWSSAAAEATDFYTGEALGLMVKDMGVEVIRFALGVQEKDGGSDEANNDRFYLRKGKEDQRAMVKSMVYAAVKQDVYIILDWHVESTQGYTTDAVEFFSWAAKEFGKTNNVIFEVWNEPTGGANMSNVASHANSVIKAIRDAGSDNLVLVGSPSWSSQPDACANASISDSKNNYGCSLHFYAATHKMGGYDKAAETAMSKGIPVFATEWGTVDASGKGSPDLPSSQDWVTWMKNNKVSWANWSASAINESSAAFTTRSLAEGLKYSTSGSAVKGYIGTNSYTDCHLENYIGSKNSDDSFSEGVADGAKTNVIDDFEDGDRYAYSGGFWSAWSDADESGKDGIGKTSAKNAKYTSDFGKEVYDVVLKNNDAENTSKYVAGLEGIYIDGGDQYNGGYKWDPYIAMGLNLTKDTTEFKDFANCKTISYKYKGAKHNFRVEISSITNFNYHYYQAEAASEWTTVELTTDMFKQHADWQNPQITSLASSLGKTKRLAWEVNGLAGLDASQNQPKYNYLYVDDVRCDGLSFSAISGKAPVVEANSSSSAATSSSSSSNAVIASSSSAPVVVKSLFVIDDAEDGDEVLKTTGTWYAYSDSASGGKSTITNVYSTTLGGYVVNFLGSADATNGTLGYTGISGIVLNQGEYVEAPFVALGLNTMADTSMGLDMSKCAGVSYRYKGSRHTFKIQDGQVQDYAYHEAKKGDATEWTTVVLLWDDINQPTWGEEVDLNHANIKKMSWEVTGVKGLERQPTIPELYVDDVTCLAPTMSIKTAARAASSIKISAQGTSLNISVAKAGMTRVQVFDMMGHVVANVAENMSAGTHQVSLDNLSRGNYMVRVMSGSEVKTSRIAVK